MDKTERTIAKVTNAGRILSRIAWIFDLLRIRHKNDARRHGIDAEVVHRAVCMNKFLTSKAHFVPSSSSAARMAMRVAVSIRRAR